jgi:dTMP kinase
VQGFCVHLVYITNHDTKTRSFIAIEGVSGAGKPSVLKNLRSKLDSNILFTKEPTPQFQLSSEDTLKGNDLFELLLQDRLWHVQNEILPAVQNGGIIISDRYILSSLVFQKMDGLDIEYIWSRNTQFPIPDLTVVLTVSEDLRAERLKLRQSLSRLKQADIRLKESIYTKEAIEFVQSKGWSTITVDTSTDTLDQTTNLIYNLIQSLTHANTSN